MNTKRPKDPKSMFPQASSDKKGPLIAVLRPFCSKVPWMKDGITLIEDAPIPNTYFEMLGISRLSAYMLLEDGLDNKDPLMNKLKSYILQCDNKIKITHTRKKIETLLKEIEDAHKIDRKKNRSK